MGVSRYLFTERVQVSHNDHNARKLTIVRHSAAAAFVHKSIPGFLVPDLKALKVRDLRVPLTRLSVCSIWQVERNSCTRRSSLWQLLAGRQRFESVRADRLMQVHPGEPRSKDGRLEISENVWEGQAIGLRIHRAPTVARTLCVACSLSAGDPAAQTTWSGSPGSLHLEPVINFRAGGAGDQFFRVLGARSDAYRVSASDERQRNRENWPQPEGLRCKSGHTSFSPSTVDPRQLAAARLRLVWPDFHSQRHLRES
jgi:hypothetical protein